MTDQRRDVGAVGDERRSGGESDAQAGGSSRHPGKADAPTAQQRPLDDADPGTGEHAAEHRGRHRVDASGHDMSDEAGGRVGERREQPPVPRPKPGGGSVMVGS